jgi:hypothetical protein
MYGIYNCKANSVLLSRLCACPQRAVKGKNIDLIIPVLLNIAMWLSDNRQGLEW